MMKLVKIKAGNYSFEGHPEIEVSRCQSGWKVTINGREPYGPCGWSAKLYGLPFVDGRINSVEAEVNKFFDLCCDCGKERFLHWDGRCQVCDRQRSIDQQAYSEGKEAAETAARLYDAWTKEAAFIEGLFRDGCTTKEAILARLQKRYDDAVAAQEAA